VMNPKPRASRRRLKRDGLTTVWLVIATLTAALAALRAADVDGQFTRLWLELTRQGRARASPQNIPHELRYDLPQRIRYELRYDPAKPFWTKTGVHVRAGDRLMIDATGQIIWDPHLKPVGPDGADWTPQRLPSATQFLSAKERCALLMAAIGPRMYPIGTHAIINVGDSAELELSVNERWLSTSWKDNRGYFSIIIVIERPTLPNSSLELPRGPFLGRGEPTARRHAGSHLASSASAIGGGSQHAAVRPASGARVQLSVGVSPTAADLRTCIPSGWRRFASESRAGPTPAARVKQYARCRSTRLSPHARFRNGLCTVA
jgi:hypothetical protein